jgi:predicted TIM-barrel fold metal-dependent hydrolase
MPVNQYLQHFELFKQTLITDGHLHVWKGFRPNQIWDTLDKVGVQSCNALSINNFTVGGTLNEEAFQFKKASNGRAYAFGSLDYIRHLRGEKMNPRDLVDQAHRIKSIGFDGIKMWEGKPLAYIVLPDRLDGAFFDPYFKWMEEEGFPIVLHLADAPRFWDPSRIGMDPWSFAGDPYPSRQGMYGEIETILSRYPRLKLILAHFLFLWGELMEARRILDAHPSIAFDLTPGVQGYLELGSDTAAARQFFLDYQDRLIYGSDIGATPLLSPEIDFEIEREALQSWLVRSFLETDSIFSLPGGIGITQNAFEGEQLRGIALPSTALEKIYRKNFERMVGEKPAKL